MKTRPSPAHEPTTARLRDAMPETMRAVLLEGTGFERIALRTVSTPRAGPRQLVGRVDAAGICSSLVKIAEQGPRHKLLYGWDVEEHPLILGDEGSITIVEVGEELAGRYEVGQRFVVQPAVSHPPVLHRERYCDGGEGIDRLGVGYTLPGHLAEYILVTEETIEGQSLLPLPDDSLPYAHAALSEPFSCVLSGQEHHLHLEQDEPLEERRAVKGLTTGGVTVVVGAGAMGRMHVDLALTARPRLLLVADLIESRLNKVESLFGARARELGVDLRTLNSGDADVRARLHELTHRRGADDVIVAVGLAEAVEAAQHLVARNGVLNIFGGLKKGADVIGLDTGIVHYQDTVVTGSSGGSPWDVARTLELMTSGAIDAGAHIARVGDLSHAVEFLRQVRDRELDGKAVVYPHTSCPAALDVDAWSAENERVHLRELAGARP